MTNPTNKFTASREVLHELYVEQGLGVIEVGRRLGTTETPVKRMLREYGIPIRAKGTQFPSIDARLDKSSGCWIWTGYLNRRGYGWMRLNRRNTLVHRYIYERERGPIPEGLDLDHLCRVPACCNPDHLEPVSHAENVRRGAVARAKEKHLALRNLGSDPPVRQRRSEVDSGA